MEEDLIKVVVFEHYNLISKIEEVQTVEIGDPNCKLVNPYTVKTDGTLEPFLVDITRDKETETEYAHKGLAQRSFKRAWTLSDDTEVRSVEFSDGLLTVVLGKIVPEHHARKNWF